MNKFEATMKTLEGKTILSVDADYQVPYKGDFTAAVKFTCTDGTIIILAVDTEEDTLFIGEEEDKVPWSCIYNERRDEVYVYDSYGKQLFSICSEQLSEAAKYMSNIQLKAWLRSEYSDCLSDYGLE